MSFLVMGSNGVISANLFLVSAIFLLNGGVYGSFRGASIYPLLHRTRSPVAFESFLGTSFGTVHLCLECHEFVCPLVSLTRA
jgi:hypothetical protein